MLPIQTFNQVAHQDADGAWLSHTENCVHMNATLQAMQTKQPPAFHHTLTKTTAHLRCQQEQKTRGVIVEVVHEPRTLRDAGVAVHSVVAVALCQRQLLQDVQHLLGLGEQQHLQQHKQNRALQ